MFTCSWCWLKTGNCFSSQTPLTKLHITCEGTIEDDGYGMLQVREYAKNARVGETWTHWIFGQTSCVFECAWSPSSFPSLSRLVLESSTQNAYYCWKGLWGSIWCVEGSLCWDWGRGLWASCAFCVDDTSCVLSGWPALAFTFCLPPVATNWQLMCTHDQLRGTLQLGLMDALLGWGLWWGADSLSKQTLEAGSLSQRWVTSLGRSALKLLLIPLQLLPGVWSGLSTGQWATVRDEIVRLYVPHGCFLTKTIKLNRWDVRLFWITNRLK